MCTAEEQFAKFERDERALRRAERDERAARLRFPLARANLPSIKSDEEWQRVVGPMPRKSIELPPEVVRDFARVHDHRHLMT